MDKEQVNKEEDVVQEVADVDIDYLSNGDYQEYNGNSEVGTAEKFSVKKQDGHQITTDEFGQFISPRGYFGSRSSYNYGIKESFLKEVMNNPKLYEAVKNKVVERILYRLSLGEKIK